jgi:hypothetical protein
MNSILNLARTNIMKKTRIEITHQVEKTKHHFMVVNPEKLSSSEVDRIKKIMGVEMAFVNGRLYK